MPGKGQRSALGCAVTAAALSCDIPLGVTEADAEFAGEMLRRLQEKKNNTVFLKAVGLVYFFNAQ